MKHTPGPWAIEGGASNRVYLVNDKRGEAIGEIVYTDTRKPADARLIAAAPELLEALQRIAQLSYDSEAVRVSSAAIAKATGSTA